MKRYRTLALVLVAAVALMGARVWTSSNTIPGTFSANSFCLDAANQDTCLVRDAADTLAQRRGTNAQTTNWYKTYVDASNYGRLSLQSNFGASSQFGLTTESAGSGSTIDLYINVTRNLHFGTGGIGKWSVVQAGNFNAATDNLYDIGASGANRPRSIYYGTQLFVPNGTDALPSIAFTTNTGFRFDTVYGIWVHAGAQKLLFKDTEIRPKNSDEYDLGFNVTGWKRLYLAFTNTTPGTTGNQTINKATGRVNIAAGGGSVIVTNSRVRAAAEVMCTLLTVDATAKSCSAQPGAGTMTLTLNAVSTGEVALMWLVINTDDT